MIFNLDIRSINFFCNRTVNSQETKINKVVEKLKNNLNVNNPEIMCKLVLNELILLTNSLYGYVNVLKMNEYGEYQYQNVVVSNLDMNSTFFVKGFNNICIKHRGVAVGCIGIGGYSQKINGIYQELVELLESYLYEISIKN